VVLGGIGDTEVVGNDVDDHAEPAPISIREQRAPSARAAAGGVDGGDVHDVVPVIGA
jgi:hypothetical protein